MYSIGEFSKKIGKSIETLRLWDKQEKLKPAYISKGGHRMYSDEQLNEIFQQQKPKNRINVGYVRVSARHQMDDLKRQKGVIEIYLAKQGKPFKIVEDIGSGINYSKKGLKELLKLIATNQIETLYILYKDRLLRFGYELIEEFCKLHNTSIEIINQDEEKIAEAELVDDILNIVHIFSCRMNGRS